MSNPAPPRGILLDIEGTTSSISFVHDVMFPFAREHLDEFLDANWSREDVQRACEQIAADDGHASLKAWRDARGDAPAKDLVRAEVHRLMDGDAKATGLKALQGLIWHGGFHSGQLAAHVYPDVIPAIERWRDHDIDVRIYSSGSVTAQKLFFGHVAGVGDCLHLFSGHYDTAIGGKKDSGSYLSIAADWGLSPADIVFISDIAEELEAAQAAGFQVLASIRPGNSPLPPELNVTRIETFESILS